MTKQELPGVGDVVVIPGERTDGITRAGTVVGVKPTNGGRILLTLRRESPGSVWVDYWDSETMLVVPGDCGHERTGGYVYTGDPVGSRSMRLECQALHYVDGEGTGLRAHDEEGMEVEVTVTGMTLAMADRVTGRAAPARDAVGALRAVMAGYLDTRVAGRMPSVDELMTRLVAVVYGWEQEQSEVWLAEELQDMLADRG